MFSIQMNEMKDPIGMVDEKDDWWQDIQLKLQNVELIGIIDAMWEEDDGDDCRRRVINEYKSNCLKNSLGKSKIKNIAKQSMQPKLYNILGTYGYGAMNGGDGKVVIAPLERGKGGIETYVYGIEGGWKSIVSNDEKDMKEVLEEIADVVGGIRRKEFDAVANGFNCTWCGYREVCGDSVFKG